MADGGLNTKSFMDTLGKKAGPFPVGVWLGIGGIAGVYFLKTRQAASGTKPTSAVPTTVDATGLGNYVPAGSSAGGGGGSGAGAGTGTGFADNNAWGTASINYLVGLGYDAAAVNQAVSNYLASQPLTTQQQAWVNLAIQHFQAPPQLVPPVNGNVPPVNQGGGGSGGGGTSTQWFPVPPGSPPSVNSAPGSLPLIWITQQGDTLRKIIPKMYANDPQVNGSNPDAQRIEQVATFLYQLNENHVPFDQGIDTPLPGGLALTYFR